MICSIDYSKALEQTEAQSERKTKHQCIVCGLDVAHKKKGTLTCSRKCRNQKSDSYQDFLKKVRKDLQQNTLFDVSQMVDVLYRTIFLNV